MSVINTDQNANELPAAERGWQPLRLFNLYRLTLAGLFLTLFISPDTINILGTDHPALFRYVITFYLVTSIFFSFAINQRWLPFALQVHLHVAVDIIALTLLMHASGGIDSGFGMLLIISIASGSILTSRRIAVLFGSMATIAILIEEGYSLLTYENATTHYTQTGILGATLIATALIANMLARRSVESEALARQRGLDLANLEQLNDYIIQHMQTGILVIDENNRIRLMNESARRLLNLSRDAQNTPLENVSLVLQDQLQVWLEHPDTEAITFRSSKTSPEIQPRFARLGNKNETGILIFLEDTTAMAQRAQQLKLASLGRLTASIAHEIRNPLGAISHASQLLSESTAMEQSDLRLTQIIDEHSQRMNRIIENVMRLSRRDRAQPVLFTMDKWLQDFVADFQRSEQIDSADLAIAEDSVDIEVRMDPSQLHQVVWNLVRNGLRHSKDYDDQPKVILCAGLSVDENKPYLDIIDHGEGISPEQSLSIFEPFYTTASSGVGLGLYIARELCEGNQARLDYIRMGETGRSSSCFRITFADTRRKQIV